MEIPDTSLALLRRNLMIARDALTQAISVIGAVAIGRTDDVPASPPSLARFQITLPSNTWAENSGPMPVQIRAIDKAGALVADYVGKVALFTPPQAILTKLNGGTPPVTGAFEAGFWQGTVELDVGMISRKVVLHCRDVTGAALGSSAPFMWVPLPASVLEKKTP